MPLFNKTVKEDIQDKAHFLLYTHAKTFAKHLLTAVFRPLITTMKYSVTLWSNWRTCYPTTDQQVHLLTLPSPFQHGCPKLLHIELSAQLCSQLSSLFSAQHLVLTQCRRRRPPSRIRVQHHLPNESTAYIILYNLETLSGTRLCNKIKRNIEHLIWHGLSNKVCD